MNKKEMKKEEGKGEAKCQVPKKKKKKKNYFYFIKLFQLRGFFDFSKQLFSKNFILET